MRAVKRSVLRIRGTEGCIYEEAYFIIKDGEDASYKTENVTRDMVFEANRIIEENFEIKKAKQVRFPIKIVISFILGVVLTQILNIIF